MPNPPKRKNPPSNWQVCETGKNDLASGPKVEEPFKLFDLAVRPAIEFTDRAPVFGRKVGGGRIRPRNFFSRLGVQFDPCLGQEIFPEG